MTEVQMAENRQKSTKFKQKLNFLVFFGVFQQGWDENER